MENYFYAAENLLGIDRRMEPNNGWVVLAFDTDEARDEYVQGSSKAIWIEAKQAQEIIGGFEMVVQRTDVGAMDGGYIVTPGYPLRKGK